MRSLTASVRAVAMDALRHHLGRWHFPLALLALAWLPGALWVDAADGMAAMRVGPQRVLEDSTMLVFAYGTDLTLWTGLLGFLVVRGQAERDWSSGLGVVVAASPVSNGAWTIGRWLAATVVLSLLSAAGWSALVLLHLARVHESIDVPVYLTGWFALAAPMVVFVAGIATLAENWSPLIGRRGDALFIATWFASAFAMEVFWQLPGATWNPLLLLDVPGHYSVLVHLADALGTHDLGLGGRTSFEPGLAPLRLPRSPWMSGLLEERALVGLLALLPLGLAIRLFHRHSRDRLAGGAIAGDRRPRVVTALLEGPGRCLPLLQSIARMPLALAARHRGMPAEVLAQSSVTLSCNPVVTCLLPFCWAAGLSTSAGVAFFEQDAFPLCWIAAGVAMGSIGTREHQEGWSILVRCVPGGPARRVRRELWSALLLSHLAFAGLLAAQWLDAPMSALAEHGFLLASSVVAIGLAHAARSPRPFLFLVLTTALLFSRLKP